MPKFRKKPVVIEAMQFLTCPSKSMDCTLEFDKWMYENQGKRACMYKGEKLVIRTLEGEMTADQGDWIIKGIRGELYPCKPDIFEATYEPVK